MNQDKYKALIKASGGFTSGVKRGDRPQPLSIEDELALTKAWQKSGKAGQSSGRSASKRGLRSRSSVKS